MSFEDRLAHERRAAVAADAERKEELARSTVEAQATMRRLTVDFIKQARRIGWRPTSVMTVRNGPNEVSVGLFKTITRWDYLPEETLGDGWVVIDHDPLRTSDYGVPATRLIVLTDGRWIDCGLFRSGLVNPDAVVVEGSSNARGKFLALDVSLHPVTWLNSFSGIDDPEKLLIDQLLRVEDQLGK